MKKHCGNCANYRKKTNQFSDACGKCVAAVLENGERTDPSQWREKPMTNADHFREAISTEDGMAKFLMKVHDEGIYITFCQEKEECWELLEENGVPDGKCMECMMQWLRKPYEGD